MRSRTAILFRRCSDWLRDPRLGADVRRLFLWAMLVVTACAGLGCQASEPEEQWSGVRRTEPSMNVIHYEMEDSFLNVQRYPLEFRNVRKATFSIYMMAGKESTLLGSVEASQVAPTDEVFTGDLFLGLRSEQGTVGAGGGFQPAFLSIASQGMLSGSRNKTLDPYVLDDSHQFQTNTSAFDQTVSSGEQFIFFHVWRTGGAEEDHEGDPEVDDNPAGELGPFASSFERVLANSEDTAQYYEQWGDLEGFREKIANVDDRVFMVGTIRVE